MQIQSINNYSQQNNNFCALKKVRCNKFNGENMPCLPLEKRVVEELRELAKKNKFFKDNDVQARVKVERWHGTEVRLESKPVAKNFLDRIKKYFADPKVYTVKDNHPCPDDSSFFVAGKLRNISNNKEDFLAVFSEDKYYYLKRIFFNF